MSDLISKSALMKNLGIKDNCSDCRFQDGLYCKKSGDFINACGVIFDAPTIEIDLQEIEDRFGKYVRFVVEDMISGENKRWKNEADRC